MPDDRQLTIKKYQNRRFYDATRSCHVTLADMHDLICAGHDLAITDSVTGDDITNVVLSQILIERDPTKLNYLPPNVLHDVIRTREHLLGGVFEGFFRQLVSTQRSSQEQWSRFLQNTLGMTLPPNWPAGMMGPFQPRPSAPTGSQDSEIEALRKQVATLARKLEAMDPNSRS